LALPYQPVFPDASHPKAKKPETNLRLGLELMLSLIAVDE